MHKKQKEINSNEVPFPLSPVMNSPHYVMRSYALPLLSCFLSSLNV